MANATFGKVTERYWKTTKSGELRAIKQFRKLFGSRKECTREARNKVAEEFKLQQQKNSKVVLK